jgi:acyl-CoA reductase-like NAD-dependent aldehyde dehydrogenase
VCHDEAARVHEIAVPMGVVAGVIPVTNPTSTALFKILISLKGRNGIVLSPHPRAVRCIAASAEVAQQAAVAAGAPPGILQCLATPTLAATGALMTHPDVAVILATGGSGLVRAAYSSGKPAFGVGPGNVPVWVDRSADPVHTARCLSASKTFDYGTLCSSEQAIVIDAPIKARLLEALRQENAVLLAGEDREKLARLVQLPGGGLNTGVVGQSAPRLAQMAGFAVPPDTTILLVEETGVGPAHPFSMEILAPILAVFTAEGWEAGCERCIALLRYGGMGHTLGIHATDEKVIREFALQKPAGRIVVNAPTSQGAVGFATRLMPSMTLGCGTMGGNISTDNITASHLVQIKRLAYGDPAFFQVSPAMPAPPPRTCAAPVKAAVSQGPLALEVIQARWTERNRTRRKQLGIEVTPRIGYKSPEPQGGH